MRGKNWPGILIGVVLKTGGTTIEHTNFDSLDNYKGTHIAYLSRYLAVEDPVWLYSDDEYFDFAMRHLKRMFPKIDESWVVEYKVWRSEYAQPVTERDYSSYIPARDTPFKNAFIPLIIEDA
nr:FAD-dependent oxidoreductase [Brenneria ulupoensis]